LKTNRLSHLKSRWLSIGLLLAAGCTTAHVQAARQIPTLIEPHDSVAIVVSHDATDLASEAVGCISKALKEAFPALRTVSPEEFHKAAFPDIPLEMAPRASIYVPLLLNDPTFRVRIAPLDLQYLISVQGKTDQKGETFAGGAGGGGGAVTWFGWSGDRNSKVTASVLDLKQRSPSGEIKATASGKPWFVCVGLLVFCAPLGAPAFTEAKACSEIGLAVAKFLAGEGTSQAEQALRKEYRPANKKSGESNGRDKFQ
jgi:hypothetical protein